MIKLKWALISLLACTTAQANTAIDHVSPAQAIRQADAVVIGRMGAAVSTEQVVLRDQYDDLGHPTQITLTVDVHEFKVVAVVSGKVSTDTVLVRRVRSGNQPAAVSGDAQMIGLQSSGRGAAADQFVVVHDVALSAPPESVAKLTRWAHEVRRPEPEDLQAAMELAYGDTGNFDVHGDHSHAGYTQDFLVDESTDARVTPNPQMQYRSGPQEATVGLAPAPESSEAGAAVPSPAERKNLAEDSQLLSSSAAAPSLVPSGAVFVAVVPSTDRAFAHVWMVLVLVALGLAVFIVRSRRKAGSAPG